MADEINDKSSGQTLASSIKSTSSEGLGTLIESGMMSEEELDNLIQSEDPEFYGNVIGIAGTAVDGAELYEYEEDEDDKDPLWGRPNGWRKVVKKIFPYAPKIAKKIKRFRERLKWIFLSSFDIARKIIKEEFPRLGKILFTRLLKLRDELQKKLKIFTAWPLKKKIGFVVVLGVGGIITLLTFRVLTKGILPKEEDLFIRSLEPWAQITYVYDPNEKRELFYESGNASRNLVLLNKLIANIRPTGNSSSNPMLAIELFLEGTSSEVMIEVKDREPQVRDEILRTMEASRYVDLLDIEGKQHLSEEIRKAANHILTTGKIKKVFFRTFIMKP